MGIETTGLLVLKQRYNIGYSADIVELVNRNIRYQLSQRIAETILDGRQRYIVSGKIHDTLAASQEGGLSADIGELGMEVLVLLINPRDAEIGEYVADTLLPQPESCRTGRVIVLDSDTGEMVFERGIFQDP